MLGNVMGRNEGRCGGVVVDPLVDADETVVAGVGGSKVAWKVAVGCGGAAKLAVGV